MSVASNSREGEPKKPLRGFARLAEEDPEALKRLSAKGARRAHELGRAHTFTAEEACEAGRKGGLSTQVKKKAKKSAAMSVVMSVAMSVVTSATKENDRGK
jgi:general stress protein YciG